MLLFVNYFKEAESASFCFFFYSYRLVGFVYQFICYGLNCFIRFLLLW
jgi:hypothetical protein